MSGDRLSLYGTHEREPESRALLAGDLSVTLQDGNLRMLRFAGHEVLRAVAFLVRDRDWGTCRAAIADLDARVTENGFSVPRHNGAFGAAWTLAYAGAGLEVLTLSTLAGPFGLVAGKGEATREGRLRPLAHILRRLGALTGAPVYRVETLRPDAVLGLACEERLLMANITPEPQRAALPSLPRAVALIGGEPLPAAGQVVLPPYGCVEVVL